MEQYQRKTMNLYNIICQSQPGNYYEYNLKSDKETLLNRINSSIMIDFHGHPLFSCFTPQRANCSQYWTCFQCKCNYSYKVPSFYCTACNYDLCQKCLMQCKLFTIQMYDYSKNEYKNINMNPNQLNTYAHNHCMTLIQPENYNTDGNYVIHCKSCRCDIKSKEYFYYCSLCNFYICQNCFNGQRPNNNNPYNQPQNFPNQFQGNNLGNNPQIYNRVNNNQFNNINNNNNIQNNGSQEYINNQGNNIKNNYTNPNIKNINGQNMGFNQINNNSNNNNNNFSNINNINNINNNNTDGQNFNNINNNFPSSELPNQSQNNTNTSEIINPLVMNSKNTDNKQINNDKPSDNNNNIRQSEIEQVEDYLSGNQIQFNQNHQNAK